MAIKKAKKEKNLHRDSNPGPSVQWSRRYPLRHYAHFGVKILLLVIVVLSTEDK